jgi:dienelactone hydrolase
MKITEILAESLAQRKIPFEISFQHEWDDPNRDENLDPIETISVEGYVVTTPRMYSERGSPTGYDVVFTHATDSNGQPFDLDQLNDRMQQQLRQSAIDQATE